MTVAVRITRIDQSRNDISLPAYATAHSAGMDIRAAVDDDISAIAVACNRQA